MDRTEIKKLIQERLDQKGTVDYIEIVMIAEDNGIKHRVIDEIFNEMGLTIMQDGD